ncbi:Rha family transcriptional regulator [Bacillus cereus]|uniref:Rha family transcriptional regulator n=1 Tax=Bacillus cereus TaxID=1396 RepID=UPI002ABF6D5E|nr:Rha family transcriptional regulator [Bacillus cereus]MDZ4504701.1 Rha family transcriptional regulator [Bacillus cereus]
MEKGETKEEPLFLAKDVANWIGHSNARMMLQNIDEDEKQCVNNPYASTGQQQQWFLTEDGMYEVLMQSRKPIAKQFDQRNFAPVGYKDEKGKLNFQQCDYINNKTKMSNIVFIENNEVVTDSLNVAGVFGKEHSKVIRAIESMQCSDEFRKANFGVSEYKTENNNKSYKKYLIKKDGLSFLVMGFTGEKAAQFKEMYIMEFNRMEKELKNRNLDSFMIADPIARKGKLNFEECDYINVHKSRGYA